MKQLLWTTLIATWAFCAAAQTFSVVQNQPQALSESPNATKEKKSSSTKSTTRIDASGTTGDQMKKPRTPESSTSGKTPRKSTVGSTAHSETKNNAAGSIAGKSNTLGRSAGLAKPPRHNNEQAPVVGAQTAKVESTDPAPEPKPQAKPTPRPAAMSGPAAPPYHAPAWLPQSPDSNTLQSQLESALGHDESLVGSKLDVVVDDSEINLKGTVPGSREKLAAERIARSFAGNRRVVSKLTAGAQASQPGKPAAEPAPQKMNSHQPAADMPATSFAPQSETRPADATSRSAQSPAKAPETSGEQSPKPREN